MSFPQLPPQAYTRDVLAAAYEWLRSQPISVQEMAKDSDQLVSLFMHSKRRPNHLSQMAESAAPSTPVTAPMTQASAEVFKNELKVLVEGMKQFDEPKPKATLPPQVSAAPVVAPPSHVVTSRQMTAQLDTRSLEILHAVKNRFNLSNDNEALRLLIVTGYEKVFQALGKF